ncbi:MAG: phosphopentomutase [Armatimonadetes bacterium]|nr:phosphopentomutase [Armatimonadota bacterium]
MIDLRRVIILVLDSVGIGALPDAASFGDEGSNTLGHISEAVGGLRLPNLGRLGLGLIAPIRGVEPARSPEGSYGRMAEISPGKDTTTGHWEITGIVLNEPFPTYPDGFPRDLLDRFERAIGRKTLGNKPFSGTEILKELGPEHLRTGYPIVYTSADSVFQVAAHEELISVEELYRMCRIAREMLQGEHRVSRVIARPFVGAPGRFTRTEARKDFSLPPTGKTLLDHAKDKGLPVTAIGKIEDIFAGRGVTMAIHTGNNRDGSQELEYRIRKGGTGIIFANLVDFDMLYGHRNDAAGYARALEEFDVFLPDLLAALSRHDLFLITADHGNDPTAPGTDHTREYVPLIACGPDVKSGVDLGTRSTFCDIAATAAEVLSLPAPEKGSSFLDMLKP